METNVSERQFLQRTLKELSALEEAAEAHYHGVLASILKTACREAEMLLREDVQAERWPRSVEERWRSNH